MPIASMYGIYVPTFTIKINQCAQIYHTSMVYDCMGIATSCNNIIHMKQQTLILRGLHAHKLWFRRPFAAGSVGRSQNNFEWRSASASEEIIRSASFMIDLSTDWSFLPLPQNIFRRGTPWSFMRPLNRKLHPFTYNIRQSWNRETMLFANITCPISQLCVK